jgi:hypothetical protein
MAERRAVFLNGPPRSGKDTLARLIVEALAPDAIHLKMAEPLKRATHLAFAALSGATFCPSPDHFEDCKDEPNTFFLQTTPRQAYIAFSEGMLKPLLGKGVFGHLAIKALQDITQPYLVYSDCGFYDELVPLTKHIGYHNCRLVRLHRPGLDFRGDSRSYVKQGLIESVVVNNFGTIEDLQVEAQRLVAWLHG